MAWRSARVQIAIGYYLLMRPFSIREVVNDCVDSILRNDDALLLLTKLKHKDEYTAEHCLNVSIVIASNPKNRRRPRIMMVSDANKERLPKFRLLDLSLKPQNDDGQVLEIGKGVPDGTYGIVLQRFIDSGLALGHQIVGAT